MVTKVSNGPKYKHIIVSNRQRHVHDVIVEHLLGKSLPSGVRVHHVDGNGHNNAHSNLVVCPSQSYHFLLHKRQRALDGCGNANWIKCDLCKKWDNPSNLRLRTQRNGTSLSGRHLACDTIYARERRRRKIS